jgi:peptidoglycan hydrolase CwlO-like protein
MLLSIGQRGKEADGGLDDWGNRMSREQAKLQGEIEDIDGKIERTIAKIEAKRRNATSV